MSVIRGLWSIAGTVSDGADTFPPSSPAPVGSAAATRYTSALEAFLARSGIAQSHRVCARTYNARGGRDRGGARGWSRLAITLVVPDPHVLHSIVGRNRRRRERRDDQRARNSRMFSAGRLGIEDAARDGARRTGSASPPRTRRRRRTRRARRRPRCPHRQRVHW